MFGTLAAQCYKWGEFDHAVGVDLGGGRTVSYLGRTNLPLRSVTARRIYVNNLTGLVGNSGFSAILPKATIAQGVALITQGVGDQLLIANTGTPYVEQLGDGLGMRGKGGLSTVYPTVYQSYDPANPADETSFGMGYVELTGAGAPFGAATGAEDNTCKYIFVRGFYFNLADPGVGGSSVSANWGRDASGFCLENCKGRNYGFVHNGNGAATCTGYVHNPPAGVGVAETHAASQTIILRRYAHQYGSGAAMFSQHAKHWTHEDCFVDHGGWNLSETRTQGANALDHNWYLSSSCGDGTAGVDGLLIRRCLSMRASSHGLQARAGGRVYNNLFINNPIHFAYAFNEKTTLDGQGYGMYNGEIFSGGFDGYLAGNVISGAIDINPTNQRGWFAMVSNLKSTARIRSNFIGGNAGGVPHVILPDNRNIAPYKTYINFQANIVKGFGAQANIEPTNTNWLGFNQATAPEAATDYNAGFQTPFTDGLNIQDIAASGTNLAASAFTFVATTRKLEDYLAYLGLGAFTEQQASDHLIANWNKEYAMPYAIRAWVQSGWQTP